MKDPLSMTNEEIANELDAMGFDVDEMYECHPIPDPYPRTRRTLITLGWFGLIASITFVAWHTLRIIL